MRKLFERSIVAMKFGPGGSANASLNRSYDAEGLRGLLDRVERAIEP